MTHSKIQKMKFFIFLFVFLLAQIVTCNENLPDKSKQQVNDHPKSKMNQTDLLHADQNSAKSNKTNVSADTKIKTTLLPEEIGEDHGPGFNSDALRRGFYVFLGLGVIFIVYIVFRTFRITKSKTQMIRKYGVLTHRQDVEMRPLPLDEDEDDDTTIFDARNKTVQESTDQSSTA